MYGAGLFFECLEQLGGEGVIRELYESLGHGEKWLPTLSVVLKARGGKPLPAVLSECFDFNLYTGARARAGYGHRRSARLGEVPVAEASGALSVVRSPLFRTSSRYWRVGSLPTDAVAWWSPVAGAPDGGATWVDVHIAKDSAGSPSFTQVQAGVVTAIGGGDVFVVASHLVPQVASVPIALCIGSPQAVAACRPVVELPDAGVDAGTDPLPVDPAPPCGCTASPFPFGAAALLAG